LKRFKGFLTGKKPSSSTETKAKLKRTINQMEVKVKNYQRQSNEQYSLARQLLKSGNKAGAQQALKRRELYLSQISNSHSKIANLQRIIDTVDISADNVSLTETLEQAQIAIDSNIEMASPERTEEVMMSIEDSIEMVSEMEDSLTDTSITEIGMDVEVEDRVSIQMAELEAELNSGTASSEVEIDVSTSTESISSEASTGSTRKEEKKKLDEMRKQIEEGLRS
jgi:hypothetical protein